MFGRGTRELIEQLPELDGLSKYAVRRLLSRAWLEVAERVELRTPEVPELLLLRELRRLATALQVHAVLVADLDAEVRRACAFVAAEALDIARELAEAERESHWREPFVTGLLYLASGYDANAAVAVRDAALPATVSEEESYALGCTAAFLSGGRVPQLPNAQTEVPDLDDRVHRALWQNLGSTITAFDAWLRDPRVDDGNEIATAQNLADALRLSTDDIPVALHPDIQHFARLVSTAMTAAAERALRRVPQPEMTEMYDEFLRERCRRQPLLWPAARDFAAEALPGLTKSAVVAVPTGAGKSGVADLAIQHAVVRGWVLYLAPTNALVGQIRRQLRSDHPGVTVREFFGGSEYTTAPAEVLHDVAAAQVLVMTPEKCSLALRMSPEFFGDLTLTIFDEAHLLGERRGRGALSELVLAEVITRAPSASILLMSALIANPENLRNWLADSHEHETIVVREPWRPTRTLRAVVGIDGPRVQSAAESPAERLVSLPVRRRNVPFAAPLALLAGLQGPWASRDREDYALVGIGATTPMNVSRPRGGGEVYIDVPSASVRPTVQALAQLLGAQGQKVMAFLPRSRHDSFAAAIGIAGFGEVVLERPVEALLFLAAAELGLPTLLASTLAKGVGVHTSALLAEERRASELGFEQGGARVLFATGTLAQGLNLPATAVLIGGTAIGYDPDETPAERQAQQRSQLLNAIGRAGRARVAARAIALVIPNELPVLDSETVVDGVLPRAEFLAQEDASTAVTSALRPFFSRLSQDELAPNDVRSADQLAISYLAAGDGDPESSAAIVARSWAAYSLGIREQAISLTTKLNDLGEEIVGERGGPEWVADAARRAGVALPVAARFATVVLAEPDRDEPAGLEGWLDLLIAAIVENRPDELSLILDRSAFGSTAIASLWSDEANERLSGARALRTTLEQWLSGATLAQVGGAAHDQNPIADPGRGERDLLPRTIRVIESGFVFGVARAAGLLAATHDVAAEHQELRQLSAESHAALERFPLAIRFGAGSRMALALIRSGARPRVVGHMLAERLPAPAGDLDDEGLLIWAAGQMAALDEVVDDLNLEPAERELVSRFIVARGQR